MDDPDENPYRRNLRQGPGARKPSRPQFSRRENGLFDTVARLQHLNIGHQPNQRSVRGNLNAGVNRNVHQEIHNNRPQRFNNGVNVREERNWRPGHRTQRVNAEQPWVGAFNGDRRNRNERFEPQISNPSNGFEGNDGSNRSGINRSGRSGRNFRLGFKRLEDLSEKDPDLIVVDLINERSGFSDLLDTELTSDYIVLILRVLAKMCQTSFPSSKASVMKLAVRNKYLMQLRTYILLLPHQDQMERKRNTYFWKDVEGFFENLNIFFTAIVDTVPSAACETLSNVVKACNSVTGNFENVVLSDEVKEKLKKVEEKLNMCKQEIEKKKEHFRNHPEDIEPPDDFRQLSVYPMTQEVTTKYEAFVRHNVIEGAYRDVNHYLDIQFRLLREDFVAPLREGICHFIQMHMKQGKNRISNVKIYPNVQFLTPYYSNGQVGIVVQWDFNSIKKRKMNFENSRRFMFGSLICFTKDQFATLLFGKIIDRDPKLLESGKLVVGFDSGFDDYEVGVPYVMVECNIYFEPYYHVLRALQTMEEDNFPMKQYIIDVNRNIEPPQYLNAPGAVLNIDNYSMPALNTNVWPNEHLLNLDSTQHGAFCTALTQEFAVIQGPPGTGKTFLGLKIAKTLITNKSLWYGKNRTPMLVVCFTNHALDQFLEGLISTTDKIIRVGGQSKNKELEKFNIKNKKRYAKQFGQVLWQSKSKLSTALGHTKNLTERLNLISEFKTVFRFDCFRDLDPQIHGSWFDEAIATQQVDWLLGGHSHGQRAAEKQKYLRQDQLKKLENENNENNASSDEEEFYDADNREANIIDIDDIASLISLESNTSHILLSVTNLQKKLTEINKHLLSLPPENENEVFNKRWELEKEMMDTEERLNYLVMCLNEGKNAQIVQKPINVDYRCPHNMLPVDRWHLYYYWLGLYKTAITKKLENLGVEYRELYKEYAEIRDIEDTQVMKEMLVVGMTTTGAARLQTSLQALKCPIVIVEEAAEVLESHIIVSLTRHCQHLILIGDHQQLRPSTADYHMEKHYKLGISLFERMVKNNIHCNVLGVQHRMRPEIARLIVPAIYPKLENHSSVLEYPNINGVKDCLYFINHTERETASGDSSKQNDHEVSFLLRLARHLILNGYEPEDITIIAAYSGQLFTFFRARKQFDVLLKDVRITVLDNYQGEECKIILLSLVRNNDENNIGFLKIENRVCVALSRAKEGFYIMGNMDLLIRSSEIWPKVKDSLVSQGCYGESLTLVCQIHPDQTAIVKEAKDFDKVPEGGCTKICEADLDCGHKCTMLCHFRNREHTDYTCKFPCTKLLCDNNHVCPKYCYQECGPCKKPMKRILSCGHEHDIFCHLDPKEFNCLTLVSTTLPCEHVADKPCYMDPEKFRCPFPCDTRIEPCGHSCQLRCHIQNDPHHIQYKCRKQCAKKRQGCTEDHSCPKCCYEECPPCNVVVLKQRAICPHAFTVPCNKDVNELECQKPCTKYLLCGHKCRKQCFEPCGNCTVKVDKELALCGHKVKANCCEEPDRKLCNRPCPLVLPCGHKCQKRCRDVCTSYCKELVEHDQLGACGHQFKIPCYLKTKELPNNSNQLLKYCQEPCRQQLKCDHLCSGTCGECAQGRVHVACGEKCGVLLVCHHPCPIPCRKACQPCKRKCSYRCKHSKCKKLCGEPCTSCVEPCPRRCEHTQCNAKCGQICTVPPCTEPCNKVLKCGHPCVGFCNDKCPPLCRVCDQEELTEVFLGFEDKEDARYVLLEECGHIIESQGMNGWLAQGSNEVEVKCCPKCKTPLAFTQRYSDYIKNSFKDVIEVKRKCFGNPKANEEKRLQMLEKLMVIGENYQKLSKYSMKVFLVFETIEESLQPIRKSKRQPLSTSLATVHESKIQILEQIVDIFNTAKLNNDPTITTKLIDHINFLFDYLLKQEDVITSQQVSDFELEIKRLVRIAQLCSIESSDQFKPVVAAKPDIKIIYELTLKQMFAVQKYSDETDMNLAKKLATLNEKVAAGIALTVAERKQIVQAMGLSQGHWFKCPNGHIYVIGECGGAMQEGKCNECGEAIGGTSHRLLSSNRHAGEVDGSQFPAWPQTANDMNNYRF